MVKINKKAILIGILFTFFLVQVVFAATAPANQTKLEISKVDVKVDSKSDKNLQNGETVSPDVKPGSVVKLDVEVKNTFSKDVENLKIEDIQVESTIIGIDDSDDLDPESDPSEFDLKAGKDKSVSFTFNVPLKVEEGNYDVDINVEGDDENGTTHIVDWTIDLEVKKDKHEVIFTKKSLSANDLECGQSTELNMAVMDIGQEDEDDVVLETSNSQIQLSKKETFSLSEDIDADDNDFSVNYIINLAEDVKLGIYPINLKLSYDKGSKSKTETVNLVVASCTKEEEVIPPQETKTEEQKAPETQQPPVTEEEEQETVVEPTFTFEEGNKEEETTSTGLKQNMYWALVVLAYVVVILVIIFLAVRLFKKQ